MNRPEIVIVAAMDEKRGIGKDGNIPWDIPEDRKNFRRLTVSNPVIMGRITWDSLPEQFRPLPKRTNIIITKSESFKPTGVIIAHSIEEAIAEASRSNSEKVSIIGGAQIYRLGLPLADRLCLTLVAGDYNCDANFPAYVDQFRTVVNSSEGISNGIFYQFVELVR